MHGDLGQEPAIFRVQGVGEEGGSKEEGYQTV